MKPRLLFTIFAALALWLGLGAAPNASATLLLDEPFNYADGALETNSFGAWTNYSGNYFQVLVSSGRALLSQFAQAEDVLTVLPGGPYTNGSLYASFTVRCSALPANGGTWFAQFHEVFGVARARVFVTTNGAAPSTFRVGLANAASTATNYLATNLALSSLHRLVVRYDAAAGTARLWLDPASEADPYLPAWDASNAAPINSFALRQAPSTTNGVGVLYIDDLKIANSFAEVAAVWDNRWGSSTNYPKWEAASNWSLGTPSGANTGPLIASAPSKTVIIDAITVMEAPLSLTVSNLTVSSPDSSTTNTLLLDNAGTNHPLIVSNVLTLGAGAALILSNSALYLPGLGSQPWGSPGFYADGPVSLNDNSSVSTTNVSLLAGNFTGSTKCAITLDNSTLQAGNIVLGNADGASASLTLNNSLLTFPGGTNLLIGGAANAVGSLTVNSGQLLAPYSQVFVGAPGSGTLIVGSNGVVVAKSLSVATNDLPGQHSHGALVIEPGGSLTVGSDLLVAPSTTSTGLFSIAGGTFTATNGVVQVGSGGSGQMNISGGSTIIKQLLLGGTTNGGSGALHLTSGHLRLLSLLRVNACGIEGGDLDGTGGTVIVGELHDATMTVSGGMATNIGSLFVGYTPGYTGTFTQDGGYVSVVTNVVVGDCASGAVGNMNLDGGYMLVHGTDQPAVLDVRNGTVELGPSGQLYVDTLILTNSCGHFTYNGGYIHYDQLVLPDSAPPLALRISYDPATSSATLSWPSIYVGYYLEQNPDLSPGNWSAVLARPPTDNGTTRSVTISPAPGNMFYRLCRPL